MYKKETPYSPEPYEVTLTKYSLFGFILRWSNWLQKARPMKNKDLLHPEATLIRFAFVLNNLS